MIVSLTAYDRTGYLRHTIDAFHTAAEQAGEPIHLVARVEPSPVQDTILELLGGHPVLDSTTVNVNERKLLLQKNTRAVLEDAWALADELGDDFVLHLEDDLLIAPDGLKMAAWMRDTFRDDPEFMYVGLTNTNETPPKDEWMTVVGRSWFDCHVWGSWREGWDALRADWPDEWPNQWAQRVNDRVMADRLQARPVLSRSFSIGVRGVHCNPGAHVDHNPKGDWAATVKLPRRKYRYANAVPA